VTKEPQRNPHRRKMLGFIAFTPTYAGYGNPWPETGGFGRGANRCAFFVVRGQSKNSSLRRFLFRLRSRFSFHYAYCKSSFNLFLEILSAEHPVRLVACRTALSNSGSMCIRNNSR
jgi:hypothetical protein